MKHKKSSKIDGLILFTPNRYHDERGYFQESFNTIKFYEALGKKVEFVQDNLSYSKKVYLEAFICKMLRMLKLS